jgi:hypothetical protein
VVSEETITRVKVLQSESVDEELKEKTLLAIADYCESRYLSAAYVMGDRFNDELSQIVQNKYLRSLPDWQPTDKEPALKPTITTHESIKGWIGKVAKRTHLDLCKGFSVYRKRYVNASSLIPAGAPEFDAIVWAQGLQYGGSESSSDVRYSSECEQGNSGLASFHSLKNGNKKTGKDDWCKSYLRLDAKHTYSHPELLAVMDELKGLEIHTEGGAFTESCRSWTRVVPVVGKLDRFKLMARRNKLRLKEEELAVACSLTVKAIQDAEAGVKVSPTRQRLIAKALGTTADALSQDNITLSPLNNPMKASSASNPYSQGKQYKVWEADGLAIVGQALSRLTSEERTHIRRGWENANYKSDFEKLLVRLERLSYGRTASYTLEWERADGSKFNIDGNGHLKARCLLDEATASNMALHCNAGASKGDSYRVKRVRDGWPIKQVLGLVESAGGLAALWDEYAWGRVSVPWNDKLTASRNNMLSTLGAEGGFTWGTVEVEGPIVNSGFNLSFPSAGNETPSSTHYRYHGADVEIVEDGAGNLRLIRFLCGERADQWVPADELIAPKKRVNKRTQQVSQMYRCSERGCSCKPVHRYLKDKLACNDGNCRCRPASVPYSGPAPKGDRERWLVAIGRQADWNVSADNWERPAGNLPESFLRMYRALGL